RLLLATQPLRVLRNGVVANVWPLKFYLPIVSVVVVLLLAGLMGGSMLLWAVLAGAGVLALVCGGLGWVCLFLTSDAAEGRQPVWKSVWVVCL
ncbi:hypothetical protein M8360_31445, partial [Klebsiella pneumoniae]|nr:hypothetical protein [Klebsiella pneumoniae]